jgi:hypothetical protein
VCLAFPLKPGPLLIRVSCTPLAGLELNGSATPGDQRDAEAQGSAIDQAHTAWEVWLGVVGWLERMAMATGCGRQNGVHSGGTSLLECR